MRRDRQRVLRLVKKILDFAETIYPDGGEKAVEAVRLAMRVAQKTRLRLPPQLRRRFCRKCGTPWTGPSTFSVRVRGKRATHVVVRCKTCGHTRRFYALKRRKTSKPAKLTQKEGIV
ncbi:MAG: hypothetical protein QXD24_00240 [Candidatus Caldarchaeum sp.]